MQPFLPPQDSASLLEISGTEDEVVVVRRGEGPTKPVVIGLAVLGTLALAGFALSIAVAVTEFPQTWELENLWLYLGVVAFPALPSLAAAAFALQWYRRGWNDTVVTLTDDRISVHWEGECTYESYSFPLSDVLAMGVQTRYLPGLSSDAFGPGLVVRFARVGSGQSASRKLDDRVRRDDRHILKGGSKAELTWVRDLIGHLMEQGGWDYRRLNYVES